MSKDKDQFSAMETEARVQAALRGARLAGPQHKKSVTPKRGKKQRVGKTSKK
jgi:hypothetical protein